jgi:hypothetical protein
MVRKRTLCPQWMLLSGACEKRRSSKVYTTGRLNHVIMSSRLLAAAVMKARSPRKTMSTLTKINWAAPRMKAAFHALLICRAVHSKRSTASTTYTVKAIIGCTGGSLGGTTSATGRNTASTRTSIRMPYTASPATTLSKLLRISSPRHWSQGYIIVGRRGNVCDGLKGDLSR